MKSCDHIFPYHAQCWNKHADVRMFLQPKFVIFAAFAFIPVLSLPCDHDTVFDANLLINVNPETQQFVDSLGRERFFHGTNVVVKGPPYHPKTEGHDHGTFSEADMKFLQSLGLNAVRLGWMLAGYVPLRGQYNATYMAVMQDIVSQAAKYGIYTLLDMHQDVMSRKFCVEGFPDWAVNSGNAQNFPFPLEDKYPLDPKTGYPSSSDCAKHMWSDYYFTEASAAAFQNLYNNTDGLLDAWAEFWGKTAQGFKDYNSVIGYELINEPFAGDVFRDPSLMVPGVADEQNLAVAYDKLQKAIRRVDLRHNIFFEGVTWDFFAVGFKEVPGGADYQNRSVLSYHYYEPPDFNKQFQFEVRVEDLKRLKCAGFATELLVVSNSAKDLTDMFELFDICDQHKQSWTGWDYRPLDYISRNCAKNDQKCAEELSKENHIFIQNTSRTYPQAVAGYTNSFKFDKDTRKFIMSFSTVAACESTETIIYFNKDLHYPNGFNLAVNPEGSATWHQDGNFIILNHDEKLPSGYEINILLVPK